MRRIIIAALAIILCSHAAWAISPPALGSPSGMSPPTVQFTWGAVAGATWTRLWVSKDSSPSTAVVDKWVENATAYTATLPAGSYTCWLQAWGPAEGYSSWSAGFTFKVGELKTIMIPPSAFEGWVDDYNRNVSWSDLAPNTPGQNWYAPVYLPLGAVIESVSLYASNFGAVSSGPYAYLYRAYIFDGVGDQLALVDLSGETQAGPIEGKDSTIVKHNVIQHYTYTVQVYLGDTGTRLLAATVSYWAP